MSAVLADPMPALVTIPNVELLSAGTWNASTGWVTYTPDQLKAAVAALDDPAVHAPRLRIGHTLPTVSPDESSGGFEEQPCFGRFENLRLNASGNTIIADAVGVPAWLAEILPAAFPSRSVETYGNAKTSSGLTHDLVITSVALLGVSMPAVETLEDLRLAFGAETPEGVQFISGDRVAASRGEPMPNRVSASVTYTDVRQSFYDEIATSESDRYWWWLCDVIMSPSKVIADDDEGGLWAVPYTIKGEKITWGEPVEVRVQYVEADSGQVAAAHDQVAGGVSHRFSTAAESRPTDRVRAATTDERGDTMPIAPTAVLERLGLPEDATEEQVLAALDAEPETETPAAEAETPAEQTPAAEQVAASGVTVDPATWAQTQADAQAGRDARAEQIKARQATKVDGAVKAGKFPASRTNHYLALMEKDEDGTTAFIDSLAAGAIPVSEIGNAGETQASEQAHLDHVRAALGLATTRSN